MRSRKNLTTRRHVDMQRCLTDDSSTYMEVSKSCMCMKPGEQGSGLTRLLFAFLALRAGPAEAECHACDLTSKHGKQPCSQLTCNWPVARAQLSVARMRRTSQILQTRYSLFMLLHIALQVFTSALDKTSGSIPYYTKFRLGPGRRGDPK